MAVATKDKVSYNDVSYRRIAEILRAARDLMNSNGKHWVKGIEKTSITRVDPETHQYIFNNDHHSDNDIKEFAYCSTGAISEIAKDQKEYEATLFELIKVMSPAEIEYARESYHDDIWRSDLNAELLEPDEWELVSYLSLDDAITNINDANDTQWFHVHDWFTKAAKRTMARK